MALFENYERRIDQIQACLNKYGIKDLQEAEAICKEKGLDVDEIWNSYSPEICRERVSKLRDEAIDIINDGIVNGGEFKIDGIVAVLRDDDAVACYFGNEYQWSMPNPRDRVSIHGYQYKKGYAVDSHINEFVFIIADDTNVTLTKGTGVSDIKLVGNVGQIEIVPTAASGKTISAVQYKYTGDANYTTITPTSDGKYLMDRLVNTVSLEIKVTAS